MSSKSSNFYPRSPCGERPLTPKQHPTQQRISIHALLAESDQVKQTCRVKTSISIHALLAESDWIHPVRPTANSISIHALLAESDGILPHDSRKIIQFLSTLSLRRATRVHLFFVVGLYFYPRSPCGERQHINCRPNHIKRFLSTLSLRRATGLRYSAQGW